MNGYSGSLMYMGSLIDCFAVVVQLCFEDAMERLNGIESWLKMTCGSGPLPASAPLSQPQQANHYLGVQEALLHTVTLGDFVPKFKHAKSKQSHLRSAPYSVPYSKHPLYSVH
jgi:hypothetical protein